MKDHPEIDVELPSLQNIDLVGVAVIFSFLSGFLLEGIGLVGVFIIISTFAGISTVTSSLLIEERKDTDKEFRASKEARVLVPSLAQFKQQLVHVMSAFKDKVYFRMFLFSSVIAFSIDLGPVMVYWFDDVAQYSKGFQGSIATVSYVVALLMIIMQATILKPVRYRTLFLWFQGLQALISGLDILLVAVAKDSFWGHFIALSDKAGAEGLAKVKFIVVSAVVSEHVPRTGEATAMAFLLMMVRIICRHHSEGVTTSPILHVIHAFWG